MQWRPQITKPSNSQKVNMGRYFIWCHGLNCLLFLLNLLFLIYLILLLNVSCFPYFPLPILPCHAKNAKGDSYTENKDKVLKERKRINKCIMAVKQGERTLSMPPNICTYLSWRIWVRPEVFNLMLSWSFFSRTGEHNLWGVQHLLIYCW